MWDFRLVLLENSVHIKLKQLNIAIMYRIIHLLLYYVILFLFDYREVFIVFIMPKIYFQHFGAPKYWEP